MFAGQQLFTSVRLLQVAQDNTWLLYRDTHNLHALLCRRRPKQLMQKIDIFHFDNAYDMGPSNGRRPNGRTLPAIHTKVPCVVACHEIPI